jgi:hypothetical protein
MRQKTPAGRVFNVDLTFHQIVPCDEEGGSGTVRREGGETCSSMDRCRMPKPLRQHLYGGRFLHHGKSSQFGNLGFSQCSVPRPQEPTSEQLPIQLTCSGG